MVPAEFICAKNMQAIHGFASRFQQGVIQVHGVGIGALIQYQQVSKNRTAQQQHQPNEGRLLKEGKLAHSTS